MARKQLSGGLRSAGVKSRAKRRRIKDRIIAGKPSRLKNAGVTSRSDRRIIKENVTIAAEARAKRRARSQASGRQERRVRRVLSRSGGGRR